jgi:two-component system cell cycle response regulator
MPLVALVEDGDYARIAKALDLGVNDYILRSADSQEILARCRTQIRRRRYQDGLRATFERNVALALIDSLTGLYNRRYLTAHLAALMDRGLRTKKPLALLMVDVDHFKKVNDTLGHDAGDAVLQGVARVLSSIARKSDFVARWGGEEFVVALSNTAEAGARIAAERVRRAIAEAKYPLPNGTEHRATASIGLASAESSEWQLDDLLGRADKAMYSAKHRGRNRVETS